MNPHPPAKDVGASEHDCLRAALAYAANGWAVFPVNGVIGGRCGCGARDCSSPGKHPLTRHGLKQATTDAGVVEAWWKRWPQANVAIATGSASGIVVIDVDLPAGSSSLNRLGDQGHELPETLTVRTGSGGIHLYYGTPAAPLSNAAGRLPGIECELPGVDLRAAGGYVVAPPSLHVSGTRYRWVSDEVILARAPTWLRVSKLGSPARLEVGPTPAGGSSTRYGLAALESELEQLRRAPVGARNHTLNRAAFCLGQLIAGGELAEAEVVESLRGGALALGLTAREIERTIASGLAAGSRLARRRPETP